MLIDFRNGLPTDLIIKKGSSEFSQPLDYLGVPFRCYRCHVFGHLMNKCSLPFNKKSSGSAHKTSWVKISGLNVDDKEALALANDSEDLNLTPKTLEENVLGSQSPLLSLKPLSIVSLSDFEGLG